MQGEPVVILLVEDDQAHAEIVRRNLENFRIANRLVKDKQGSFVLPDISEEEVACLIAECEKELR